MTLSLGYIIIYVPDVPATLRFYEQAFGLKPRFLHESKMYAELETGATALAFANEELRDSNGVVTLNNRLGQTPAGAEIALVCADIDNAFANAVANGAVIVKNPEQKPWGQKVGYLFDNNGFLVELCTPVA